MVFRKPMVLNSFFLFLTTILSERPEEADDLNTSRRVACIIKVFAKAHRSQISMHHGRLSCNDRTEMSGCCRRLEVAPAAALYRTSCRPYGTDCIVDSHRVQNVVA